MLLAIDIGNTNISLGIFRDKRLLKKNSIATYDNNRGRYLKKFFIQNKIKDVIICSVVPEITGVVEKELIKLLAKRAYILGDNIKVPVKNLYSKPGQVGQDRLVNAYYSIMNYGSPLIVIDFGTAVTFDVISKRKEYIGGMILPGLKISLETLCDKTALLPRVKLNKPCEFIGRDTKNSMLSGIVYGFSCLCECLTEKIKAKIGKNTKIIITGGDVGLIKQYYKKNCIIDPDVAIKGLNLIYLNKK
ncbi:MAG: type III pantothenate kinase [Candidatus Omnitrophota bacterium]